MKTYVIKVISTVEITTIHHINASDLESAKSKITLNRIENDVIYDEGVDIKVKSIDKMDNIRIID